MCVLPISAVECVARRRFPSSLGRLRRRPPRPPPCADGAVVAVAAGWYRAFGGRDGRVILVPAGARRERCAGTGGALLDPAPAFELVARQLALSARRVGECFGDDRSEERRVGKEGVSTCSSRWSP